jgi:hypothetical protein
MIMEERKEGSLEDNVKHIFEFFNNVSKLYPAISKLDNTVRKDLNDSLKEMNNEQKSNL